MNETSSVLAKAVASVPTFPLLLKQAVAFWKEHARYFTLLVLSTVLLFVPFILVVMAFGLISVFLMDSSVFPIFAALLGLLGFFSLMFAFFGCFVGNVAWIHASFEGGALGVVGTWKKALNLKVFVNLFVGAILWAIMFLVGTLLFILPAVYMVVPFYLWIYVAVRENLGVVESIQRSFELARGFWWTLALRYGWLAIVMLAIQLLSRILLLMSAYVFSQWNIFAGAAAFVFTVLVVGLISVFVFTPVSAVFYRLMYQRVVEAKKENISVSQKLSLGEKGQVLAVIILSMVLGGAIGGVSLALAELDSQPVMMDDDLSALEDVAGGTGASTHLRRVE